jgi:hypothetical protein
MVVNGIYFNVEACAAMTEDEFVRIMVVHLAEDFDKKEEFLRKVYKKIQKKAGR